jgi:hypothetical protein
VRIAGVSDAIMSGDAPIALVRMVERPGLSRQLGEAGAASTELALHLRPGTITPVDDARSAGMLVARRAKDQVNIWNDVKPGIATPDDRFPYHAALMARDGQWYVAALAPHVDGAIVPNHPHAAYVLNNATESMATRQAGELRMVSHGDAGYTFRHGDDDAILRRTHELPQTVLGDGYQPSIVDAHVARAREAMPAFVASLDALAPTRHGWSLRKEVQTGSRPMLDFGHARTPVKLGLEDARYELNRLLPDELTAAPVDEALHAAVDAHRARLQTAMETVHSTIEGGLVGRPVDVAAMRARVTSLATQLDALPAAPSIADQTLLPEFDAFIDRLTSGNMLARDAAMRTFEYQLFGRTPGERLRNVGVALEALKDGPGFGDGGVYRLKSWLLDVADDAALVRSQLPQEHRQLMPLLDQVEEHARRNGTPGVVVNAQGVFGYEDFPDFAEVGRMGASLRTYLAIDDATGRMAPAIAEAIPADRLVW